MAYRDATASSSASSADFGGGLLAAQEARPLAEERDGQASVDLLHPLGQDARARAEAVGGGDIGAGQALKLHQQRAGREAAVVAAAAFLFEHDERAVRTMGRLPSAARRAPLR